MARSWPDGQRIIVIMGEAGQIRAFEWHGRSHAVERVVERWQVNTDWWDAEAGEIDRDYVRVTTRSGLLCDLYTDRADANAWFLARQYD